MTTTETRVTMYRGDAAEIVSVPCDQALSMAWTLWAAGGDDGRVDAVALDGDYGDAWLWMAE